jgi:hypothetical protein
VPSDQGDGEAVAGETPPDEGNEPTGEEMPPDEGEMGEPAESPLVGLANQLGIAIPEGTSDENMIAVLTGVFSGLIAAGAKIKVGSEHDLAGGANNMRDLNGSHVEPPPLFTLSTDEPLSPREKAFAEALAKDERKKTNGRLDAIVSLGVPADIVDPLREQLGTVRFALGDGGMSASLPDVEPQISLLEKLAERVGPLLTATLSTEGSEKKANPAQGEIDPADKQHQEWMQQQAEKIMPGSKIAPVKTMN